MQTTMPMRWWGVVMLVVAVTAAALGFGQGASAVEDDGAFPRPGYGSKELFKIECELLGGTFWVDQYGNTNCAGSGRRIQCDANGNDCWVTPTKQVRPGLDQHYGEPAPVLDPAPSAANPSLGRGGVGELAPLPADPVVAAP